jgi:polysaccharide pyruvyl transferase CsaB
MRVLLSGYYGFGNLGDEGLLEVTVERIRRRFAGVVLDVLSATPEATAARFGVDATPRWQMRAVRRAVKNADVVLSGGGGLLQNATSLRSLMYYASIVRSAIRAGRKTMIFAQSVGPLDAFGSMIVRRFCRGVDRATVRDERSRALLASLLPTTPVERTADPVFLYEARERVDLTREGLGPESGAYAVICLRKCAGFGTGTATIVRAVDRLADVHGVRAAFLPLGGTGDAEVSTNVIRACRSAPMLLPEASLPKAAAVIAGAKLVVGMRLHALILAAIGAVPFLSVPYDPKVTSLTDDLAYPLKALWTPGEDAPPPQSTDALVDEAIARRSELSAHLASQLAHVRRLAERNFDVLGELLA